MLTVYSLSATGLKRLDRSSDAPLPEEATWLDLLAKMQATRIDALEQQASEIAFLKQQLAQISQLQSVLFSH